MADTPPAHHSADTRRERVRAALDAAEAARKSGDIDHAISLAEEALRVAQSASLDDLVAHAHLDLGNLFRYLPNAVEGIKHLHAAEIYYRAHNDPLLARTLTRQGMILGDMGDHTRAIDLSREALGVLEAATTPVDPREEATVYGAIGVACTQLDDFEQAENAYRRSIPLFLAAGGAESAVFVYNNLAILRVRLIERGDVSDEERDRLADEAIALTDQGFAENVRAKSTFGEAALHNTRGDLLSSLGRFDEAIVEINSALRAYEAMPLPRGIVDARSNLGEAYLSTGRSVDALIHLREAEALVKTLDLKDHERKLHALLARAHEALNDSASALQHFKAFHRLELDNHRLETQKKLQQLALRGEIDRALAAAQEERSRAERLAVQNQQLGRMAHEDALTGVANRRRLDEWADAQPATLPAGIAIALLDIDHFKRINDNYSHATGDAVLRALGEVLRAHARSDDVVARYGGEEFVVVMQGLSRTDVDDSMERLRAAVQRYDWSQVNPALAVTTSIGVAHADGQLPFRTLAELADAALYRAKEAGRNRVVVA